MNRNDLVDADIPSEADNTSACSSDLAFALNHSVSPTTHMRVLHLPFQKLPDVTRGRKTTVPPTTAKSTDKNVEGKRRSNTTTRRRQTWHREQREKEGKGQCCWSSFASSDLLYLL